jgi:Ni2+-binding GTPase involved in maturation of urease and hydrogenase
MKLHLVNGFLGSGKTTAIIAATRYYLQEGKKVGIVTNDKGRYLVDTAFFDAEKIPTAQVGGGCFRCNFDELEKQIHQLQDAAAPDLIFAESVGSCVDLVNTVFSPLEAIEGVNFETLSYSVFTDIRLFDVWLSGETLPFSDSIIYTYGMQIEEAETLILNKIDLVKPEEFRDILSAAAKRFPDKHILGQNSLEHQHNHPWLHYLDSAQNPIELPNFKVDYKRYSAGEHLMAWVDRTFTLQSIKPGELRKTALELIQHITDAIKKQSIPAPHLKFYLSDQDQGVKLSFTSMDLLLTSQDTHWKNQIPEGFSSQLTILMNARVQIPKDRFLALIDEALQATASNCQIKIDSNKGTAYHPEVLPSCL